MDDHVEFNKELGLFLLDNRIEGELRDKIIEFVNRAYKIGYQVGYLINDAESI